MISIKRMYNRLMFRLIIRYIRKNFQDGLTPIFAYNSDEIIAWKWQWTCDLEREVGE